MHNQELNIDDEIANNLKDQGTPKARLFNWNYIEKELDVSYLINLLYINHSLLLFRKLALLLLMIRRCCTLLVMLKKLHNCLHELRSS